MGQSQNRHRKIAQEDIWQNQSNLLCMELFHQPNYIQCHSLCREKFIEGYPVKSTQIFIEHHQRFFQNSFFPGSFQGGSLKKNSGQMLLKFPYEYSLGGYIQFRQLRIAQFQADQIRCIGQEVKISSPSKKHRVHKNF